MSELPGGQWYVWNLLSHQPFTWTSEVSLASSHVNAQVLMLRGLFLGELGASSITCTPN